MSDLETLEFLEKFLDIEGGELRRFVEINYLRNHPSVYRAFKLGIRNIFLRVKVVDDDDKFFLKGIIDGVTFIEMYKLHLPFLWTLEKVNIHPNAWTLMNMTEDAIWLLIKSEGGDHLQRLVSEFKKAKDISTNIVDWKGRLFYMVVNQDGQREIT